MTGEQPRGRRRLPDYRPGHHAARRAIHRRRRNLRVRPARRTRPGPGHHGADRRRRRIHRRSPDRPARDSKFVLLAEVQMGAEVSAIGSATTPQSQRLLILTPAAS